jgi:hypothetical protein
MTLPALLPSFLTLAHLSCFLYFSPSRIWSTLFSSGFYKKCNPSFYFIFFFLPSFELMKMSLLHLFPHVAFMCLAFFSWWSGDVRTQQRTRTFFATSSATRVSSENADTYTFYPLHFFWNIILDFCVFQTSGIFGSMAACISETCPGIELRAQHAALYRSIPQEEIKKVSHTYPAAPY